MQFLKQTFLQLNNCTKNGVFGSCSNRPIHRYKTKNVVLVMQLALFLQVLHLHSTNVAKNKLLWAKLMSGFTCFISFLDLNSWPGWRAKKSCIVMVLIKKILEFSTSMSGQWHRIRCFMPLKGKVGWKIEEFFFYPVVTCPMKWNAY